MVCTKSRNTKKQEMTANEMLTNKLQEQIKYQEKIVALQKNRQLPTKKKKKIFIVGDSIIKNITGTVI